MKKHNILLCLFSVACTLHAQDPRERAYYYEILEPGHEAKPKTEGWAENKVTEYLDRGLTAAVTKDGNGLYVNWRLFKNENENISFNLYRTAGGKTKRLNASPITGTTGFTDTNPVNGKAAYAVKPVIKRKEQDTSGSLEADFSAINKSNYHSVPLKDKSTKAGKIAVADLNGDGFYDYILRTPSTNTDPGFQKGDTLGRTYKIEAYLHDGTFLWSYDMGQGIEPGVWYSPFVAFDFNGDGKAEVALKTAPDTIRRDKNGHVGYGEEYLTILDGMTGKKIAQANWPERNDRYGNLNRQNRNQIGIAYLDGKTPYILACRGTYKLMVVDAWQLNGNRLERAWRWDGDEENPVTRSMGSHNMVCADVDNDGRDEILLGSCMLDDNGTLLWSAGLGHPDKIYLTDIDPQRPGMEVFLALEPWHDNGRGVCVVDAATGEAVWNIGHKTMHVGDGMVADFDPNNPGMECFASEDGKGGSTDKYLLTAQGGYLGKNEDVPGCRNWIWWDGDLLRETFGNVNDRWGAESMSGGRAQQIVKWKGETLKEDIQGDIIMIADLLGDWREEVITALDGEIRIYYTGIPAEDKRVCLMQDDLYRNYVAHRSMGYPQSPVPSYYLGLPVEEKPEINTSTYAQWFTDSEIKRFPQAWQLDHGKRLFFGYAQGVGCCAMLKMWKKTGDRRYFDYVEKWAGSLIDSKGDIRLYNVETFNIDYINSGKVLFDLYRITNNEKYKLAMDKLTDQMKNQPRTTDGGYWHKLIYPCQMWLDGLYMASPFLAQYGAEFDKPEWIDEAVKQFRLCRRHTYDEKTGLYHHAWDESHSQKWADPETGRSPNFWGRSVGWWFMALVDALDFIPENHEGRADMINMIKGLAETLPGYQDKDGLWYQVLDQIEREGNFPEASVTAQFMYAYAKAVNKGYIDPKYKAVAEKAFKGLNTRLIVENDDGTLTLTRCCQVGGLGGNPYRDGSFEYYINEKIRDNDAKATGPFIMGCLELEK
ncbi:MAG: glycoside hydrolase family 88 protein [Tannerella sp.]|jgi:rhamnogalacturonan endolyase|nr:glycoside hydrolase family 88 protein [Tannerella sp.]